MKKKALRKKVISLGLALTLAFGVCSAAGVTAPKEVQAAETQKEAAQKAYRVFLNNNKDKIKKFTVKDLSGDKIPELIAYGKDGSSYIYTYKWDSLYRVWNSSYVQSFKTLNLTNAMGSLGAGNITMSNVKYNPQKHELLMRADGENGLFSVPRRLEDKNEYMDGSNISTWAVISLKKDGTLKKAKAIVKYDISYEKPYKSEQFYMKELYDDHAYSTKSDEISAKAYAANKKEMTKDFKSIASVANSSPNRAKL